MGAKSDFKRAHIIRTATALFGERGYRTVTMKDIAEACQISRGGLYLYYADTAALFMDVLAREADRMQASLEESMKDSSSALERLSLFLKFHKKEIFASQNNMTMAAYEFAFANENTPVLRQFLMERACVLQGIIEDGIAEGTMVCENPQSAAMCIALQFEGLRTTARTALLSTTEADAVLTSIQNSLLAPSVVGAALE